MTPTVISRSAPNWLRELDTARTAYQELFGWPVSLEVSARRLTMAVGQIVDAIVMPAALGEQVQFQLQVMMLNGPVIAGPESGWLTFVTEPCTSTCPHLPPDLEPALVRPVPRGAHIVLPIARTTHRLRDLRWLSPPRPCRKPPEWAVVVGASRRVVSGQTAEAPTSLAA